MEKKQINNLKNKKATLFKLFYLKDKYNWMKKKKKKKKLRFEKENKDIKEKLDKKLWIIQNKLIKIL